MNKKSIAALSLAVTMTLGVGASYAWFTSQAKSTNNTVQTGTLVIGLDGKSETRPFTLNNLYPGIEGSKSDYITLKNNGSINLLYKVSSTFKDGEGNLYNIADLKVTKTSGESVYNGKLKDLNSALANEALPVGRSESLNFTVSLPNDAGNEYQGKTAYVDFVFDAIQNNNTADWIGGNGYGTAVANGDGTINLKGVTEPDADGYIPAPFSYNFSNKGSWTGSYYTETSVYLDPKMENGKGFDYSVAMNDANGAYLRDFIFNLGEVDGKLLVTACNNSSDKGILGVNASNGTAITEAGWYTLQHRFYKDSTTNAIAAEMSILDANHKVVFTKTLCNSSDTSFSVPRYSWFTFITVPGGLNVQNHRDYVTP